MKIYIDGSKRAAISRMFNIWVDCGHRIVKDPKLADIQLSTVKITNKINIPVVLRLDGIYYDKGINFKSRNAPISNSHSKANGIIYQSEFSKKMCENYLSKRHTKVFNVVHNGIDPTGWNNPIEHDGINIVSCSKWRRPKRLIEIVELFKKYLQYYPNSKLHIIGPMLTGASVIPHKNIIYYGQVNFEKMRKIYSEMDIYLHMCKKDSCPSSVIESISSGIPVVTTNACGGATELCNLTKGCVVINGESESLEPDYIYQEKYNKIPSIVESRIIKSMVNITEDKRRVVLPDILNIQNIAKQYLSIMKETLNDT